VYLLCAYRAPIALDFQLIISMISYVGFYGKDFPIDFFHIFISVSFSPRLVGGGSLI